MNDTRDNYTMIADERDAALKRVAELEAAMEAAYSEGWRDALIDEGAQYFASDAADRWKKSAARLVREGAPGMTTLSAVMAERDRLAEALEAAGDREMATRAALGVAAAEENEDAAKRLVADLAVALADHAIMLAEIDGHVRWMREMLADYRIQYDDHTAGRRCALNGYIHSLRDARAADHAAAEAARRWGEVNHSSERDSEDYILLAAIDAKRKP